jgi:hypothetical protein
MVFAAPTLAVNNFADSGPMSRPIRSGGIAVEDRPRDVPGQPLQRSGLRLDQVPSGVRQPCRHITDAGMPAMHGPEPIADVQLRQ